MRFTPDIWQFVRDHQFDDVRTLALQTKKYPDVDMPAAINQIAGRQAARSKLPSWYAIDNIIYPSPLSLEQCSSELTAKYKSSFLKGETLVDLTGGLGVDCAFLAGGFKRVTYVEHQQELCDAATHNFAALGLRHIIVRHADSVDMLTEMPPVDCIFIDPARRNKHGGKTVLISDCEPDVEALEEVLMQKAARVMVKLSPMLDLSLALRSLKHTVEVCVVSAHNECKELLLVLGIAGATDSEVRIHCVNFTNRAMQNFDFTRKEEAESVVQYANTLDDYLYEPNASILKAGAFRAVASRFELRKLHPNSHLYTSPSRIETFPGRCFRVDSVCSVKDKSLVKGITKANISVRNFPISVDELRKRIKLKEGGETYLFATTLNDGKRVVVRGEKVF